jgi:hypothetical protein
MNKVEAAVSDEQLHDSYDAFTSVQRRAQSRVDRVYRMLAKSKKSVSGKAVTTQKRTAKA